ncbi:uncharacterized protein LOC144359234 [Saccoglossus kowalevskii]
MTIPLKNQLRRKTYMKSSQYSLDTITIPIQTRADQGNGTQTLLTNDNSQTLNGMQSSGSGNDQSGSNATQYLKDSDALNMHIGNSTSMNRWSSSNSSNSSNQRYNVFSNIASKSDAIETTSGNTDKRQRYLLGLQRYGTGGQNAQYSGFVNAVLFALITNRTLVLTPFFVHGGHVRGYSLEHMKQFNETFNVSRLNELLPLTTMEHYKSACNAYNTKVLTWNSINYESSSHAMLNFFGLKLPAERNLTKLSSMTWKQLASVAAMMVRSNFTCIYVACPQWSLGIVDRLAMKIPRDRIHTLRDLERDPNSIMFLDDYYLSSLVEQEICYRSDVFLAATFSTWSDYVRYERVSAGRPTYYVNELPGVSFNRTKLVK